MNRFTFCRRYDLQLGGVIGLTLGCVLGSEVMVYSQSAGERPAVTFTAEQDHQNMMNQLGIKTLRQGARAAIQLCGSVERPRDKEIFDTAIPIRSCGQISGIHNALGSGR